jgi:hypothetical protein
MSPPFEILASDHVTTNEYHWEQEKIIQHKDIEPFDVKVVK